MGPAAEPPSYSFPHAVRRRRLRAEISAAGLDALLVTDLVNIRYLTGFTGSNAALLIGVRGDDDAVLATDSRYAAQVAAESPDLAVRIERAVDLALAEAAGARHLGFEEHIVTVARMAEIAGALDGGDLVGVRAMVEGLRAVKDPEEIRALTAACAIADAALAAMIERGAIRAGRSERDIALDLDERMRRLGSEDVSFPTILAAGENSAIPHHQPTARPLVRGDLVKIDFGAVVAGYHSDMTRMFVLGAPADWQQDLHRLVRRAQREGRGAARPGVAQADVDAAAREVIDAAGYGDRFGHGLGHGVGLEIHEGPLIAGSSVGMMTADMTVTIEPGVYLPGRGGVRIEDSGVVTPDGYVPLTLAPRELIAV